LDVLHKPTAALNHVRVGVLLGAQMVLAYAASGLTAVTQVCKKFIPVHFQVINQSDDYNPAINPQASSERQRISPTH
jgi:hypothetical protein